MVTSSDDADNLNLDAIVAPPFESTEVVSNQDDASTVHSPGLRALAETIYDPIPPLREIRAKLIKVGEDGIADADNDLENNSVLLEDPDGFAIQPAVLSTWAYMLALLFDGQRNAMQVSDAFREKYSHAIQPEQALVLQTELEKAMFLNSLSFDEKINQRLARYLKMPSWIAAHAGSAYPTEPAALKASVEGFFTAPDGPGALPDTSVVPTDLIRALVIPHIDLRVGGATYAHAYKEIIEHSKADLFIILGVSHQSTGDQLYSVSQKDFETPCGIVRNARVISSRLHLASGANDLAAELAHRGEHSIEFQTTLLQSLIVDRYNRPIEIVPILCGNIDSFLARDENPFQNDEFIRFSNALRNELENCGRTWCLLCSVDLSHVGPEFGHSSMIDERLLKPLERMDLKMLKFIEKLDADGFYNEIVRTQNSRHVDAVLAVLTMLSSTRRTLKGGKLLNYDQMMKESSHSAVSFAAMSFEQAGEVV